MRYLKQNSIYVDFFQDSEFADFHQSLDAEMKRLQGSDLGSQKKLAEPLTAENEEKLWQAGVLGTHNPQALLNTRYTLMACILLCIVVMSIVNSDIVHARFSW